MARPKQPAVHQEQMPSYGAYVNKIKEEREATDATKAPRDKNNKPNQQEADQKTQRKATKAEKKMQAQKRKAEEDSKQPVKPKKIKSQIIPPPPHEDRDDEEVVIFDPEIKREITASPRLLSANTTLQHDPTAKITTTTTTNTDPKPAQKYRDVLKRKIMLDIMQIDVEKKKLQVRMLEARRRLFVLEAEE